MRVKSNQTFKTVVVNKVGNYKTFTRYLLFNKSCLFKILNKYILLALMQ